MRQPLTQSEKKRVDAFRERGMEPPFIAAEILVGRYIMEFINLQGEIENHLKED